MFKKSTVFILHFAPSLRFTLSLQSAFYPWSAVCNPQSAFYTDRGFSIRNTFSKGSFFEILNHGTKKVHEDQLKDESQSFTW